MEPTQTIRQAIIGKWGKAKFSVSLMPVKGFPRYAKATDGGDFFLTREAATAAAKVYTDNVSEA